MTDSSINPYVDILQFAPEDCPPDYYALLGLPRYTSDPKQIKTAAASQIRYVRPFCARFPTEATQLLNELTKAKLCLLDDEERAAYDARLRESEQAAARDDAAMQEPDRTSLADELADELDAAAATASDERPRRCPHCGSGLTEDEEVCRACTRGLAHRAAWKSARCPECRGSLDLGVVVCGSCGADLSIRDVIGSIPPHVPGSIKPFECRNRKRLRAERKRAMQAWRQGASPKVAPVAANVEQAPETARSIRTIAISLLIAVPLLGLILGMFAARQWFTPAANDPAPRNDADIVDAADAQLPAPEIQVVGEPITVTEGELLTYRPEVVNRGILADSVIYHLAHGELPPGCTFDGSSGELQWTPSETQGPGVYTFGFSCHPESRPADATPYAITVAVVEANSPPRLSAPQKASLPAGATLEQPITLNDDDFPANRISWELTSGPKGAAVDEIAKVLYWEIPADWQEPRVEFTVAARDDGIPPMTATHTLVLTVADISVPEPQKMQAPESTDRVPEIAVDLPPLPRPGEPIEPVPLEFELDPPLEADDVRLSLMLPDDLRDLLKMRYFDSDNSTLAILLTDPFEADDVPGNLRDGIVATCNWIDTKFVWTWAMTKDLTARAYQNNIRNGVLAVEPRSGGTPRLIALQTPEDVPAPTLQDILDDDETQAQLARHDRVKKIIALEGLECTADNGNWKVDLSSHIDGFSLLLTHPDLKERVNVRARSGGMQFSEFGFRVLPLASKTTIGLEAKPSPADTYKKLRGARKALLAKQGDARRWKGKLDTARAQLTSAQGMSANNPQQRAAKNTKINQATRAINQAQERLDKLAIQIPADQNLVATMETEWNAIVQQLQPVRQCIVSGELWRRVGDVRVPVLRLVPMDQLTVSE